MNTAQVKQSVLQFEESIRLAVAHLEEAIKILKGSVDDGALPKVSPPTRPGRSYRPGYIPKIIETLRAKGHPMTPKELFAVLKTQPGLEFSKRESLEKRIFQDLRMKRPRLQRIGKKGDGVYWIADEAIPAEKKRKSA